MKLKFADYIALFVSCLVLTCFSVAAFKSSRGVALLHIKSPEAEYYYPLKENGEYRVKGPAGETVISVSGAKARVLASPCREKICMKQGAISKPGEWIACLPNSVLISIEAESGEQWDSISY